MLNIISIKELRDKNKKIIFENQDFVIALKPIGVQSQEANGISLDMPSIIRKNIKTEDNYIGVIHRLDQGVCGLMIYAKNKKATNTLNKLFYDRKIEKRYQAIVCGQVVDKCGQLENLVKIDAKNKHIYSVSDVDKYTTVMKLEYECIKTIKYKVLEKEYDLSLLNINLITGKYHQIRYQLEKNNTPILGDKLHCSHISKIISKELGIKNILLNSYYLKFLYKNKEYRFEKKIFEFSKSELLDIGYNEWDISIIKAFS